MRQLKAVCGNCLNLFMRKLFSETSSAFTDDEFQLDDVEFQLDDMVLSREQMDELFIPSTRKNGVKTLEKLWPNKTVQFLISNKFSE